MHPSSTLPLITQAVRSRDAPMRAAWLPLFWRADCVGGLVGLVGTRSG